MPRRRRRPTHSLRNFSDAPLASEDARTTAPAYSFQWAILGFDEPLEPIAAQIDTSGMWQSIFDPALVSGRGSSDSVSYLSLSDYASFTLDQSVLDLRIDAAPSRSGPRGRGRHYAADTRGRAFSSLPFGIRPSWRPNWPSNFRKFKRLSPKGIDDPAATARLDWTPQGFHAQVLSPDGCLLRRPVLSPAARWALRQLFFVGLSCGRGEFFCLRDDRHKCRRLIVWRFR